MNANDTDQKRQKCFEHDGRAPDTTKGLIIKTRVGRPVGRRSKITKIGKNIDWSSFEIPWSFNYYEFNATNTCSL